jgi:hypothetical protein
MPRSMPRTTRLIATVCAAGSLITASLVVTADSSGQLPRSSHGCSKKRLRGGGHFTARLQAPGHRPSNWKYIYNRDERKKAWTAVWPIRVTARHRGHAINGGKVSYQFLFSGQIVACRTVLPPYKPYFRHGVFRDRIEWPEQSVGYPLTIRIVIRTRWGTRNLDYRVVVQPRPGA